MHSSKHGRGSRSSGWNSNQICLAVASGVLGVLTLFVFVACLGQPEGIAAAIGGAFCPGIFALIPTILLIRSLRKSGRKRSMSYVVRSNSPSRQGHADITINAHQKLPRICIRCGDATKRVSPLRYKDAYTEVNPYDWARATPFMIFIPFFQIIAHVLILARIWQAIEKRWNRRKASTNDLTFKIPHCLSCSKKRPIIQRHFDFHGRNMIVDAHPAFRGSLS